MRKLGALLLALVTVLASGPAAAQYVLPPGYTQLGCTAQFRDGYVRYAIFQTKTVDLALQDWRAFSTRYGRPTSAECSGYPNYDTAEGRMKELEARSPRLKFEKLAWSPNSERLTMSSDWQSNDSGSPVVRPPRPVTPSRRVPTVEPVANSVKGPTPNQLKYQRELEAYKARLADIENIKTNIASRHAADRAAAARELDRHNQEKAAANAAQRRYQQDLAEHQQRVREMETTQDRETKVDWREALVVCNLDPKDGQSRFGNWRCDGPLQMTYAKLGGPGAAPSSQAIVSLSQACGGARESVRNLGMVASSRVFGCSYGLHPNAKSGLSLDAAAKHGIGYVPGRATYRCPTWKSGCRTQ